MIRNPFDVESDAIAAHKARARQRQVDGETEPGRKIESLPANEPAGPRGNPYFGQNRGFDAVLPFGSKKDPPAGPSEPAGDPPVPPPPVPLSRHENVTAPRPAVTGAPCYRCNGKGHHLTSLSPDARMIECTQCGGAGRR